MADATPDLVSGVRSFAVAGETLVATGTPMPARSPLWPARCEQQRDAAQGLHRRVFESWLQDARSASRPRGPAADVRDLALGVLALLERAFLLGRSLRSTEPMAAAGKAAAALVTAAMPRPEREGRP